jgi:hypothetical protein
MEFEQKKENPGVKYQHEILAEYGEISQGVFQNTHIDLALEDGNYEYCDMKKEEGWIYSIGVDWNPVHGTEIMVIGADLSQDKITFKTVDSGVVYREGNTQIKATEEIARMNRKWRPEFIYVDRGAGTVQVELLEEMGELAASGSADRRLAEIITSIDFGSKITMRHPVEGTEIKVYAKPAIVENAIRRLEAGQVQLSQYDTRLEKQLRAFIVKKISATGRPVYAMIKDDIQDHRLDAWILGIFAFTMEKTRFGIPEIIPTVGFSEMPGEDKEKKAKTKPVSRNILSKLDEKAEKDEGGYIKVESIATSEYSGIITSKTRSRISRIKNLKTRGGRAPIKRSNF